MNSTLTTFLCFTGSVAVVAIIFLSTAIRIVGEADRLVVFRLGRCIGQKGPGLVVLIPIIDRGVKVSLLEKACEIPPTEVVTRETILTRIAYTMRYRIVDPVLSVTQVGGLEPALMGMGITVLRSEAAKLSLVELLARKEELNEILRTHLNEIGAPWGAKVGQIDIHEIAAPPEVKQAVEKQLADDQVRRVLAAAMTGMTGEAQADGKVNVAGQSWDAVSPTPLAPGTKVRVKRLILEVVEDKLK
jgi:regulator of protease activity HflC (stomatin/prohibitin superfamily)